MLKFPDNLLRYTLWIYTALHCLISFLYNNIYFRINNLCHSYCSINLCVNINLFCSSIIFAGRGKFKKYKKYSLQQSIGSKIGKRMVIFSDMWYVNLLQGFQRDTQIFISVSIQRKKAEDQHYKT